MELFINIILQIQLMHNYTVLNRFQTKTRVGNWWEEAELNDFNFKEYLYKKHNSANETLNKKTKLSFSSQPKQLSNTQDGCIHIGDYVELGNNHTQAVLAFNINEQILSEETYAVTTSKSMMPSLRNVFRVMPTMQTEGNVLKYGDKIRFECEAGEKKLYLQSVAVSPMRSSKFSRNQEVSVTSDLSSSSIWVIEHIDAKKRFDSVGCPVQCSEEILIKHCITGQWLASDTVPYINDFGKQFQVYAKSVTTNNKTQNLYSEKVGHRDVENPMRGQCDKNSWRILKGASE